MDEAFRDLGNFHRVFTRVIRFEPGMSFERVENMDQFAQIFLKWSGDWDTFYSHPKMQRFIRQAERNSVQFLSALDKHLNYLNSYGGIDLTEVEVSFDAPVVLDFSDGQQPIQVFYSIANYLILDTIIRVFNLDRDSIELYDGFIDGPISTDFIDSMIRKNHINFSPRNNIIWSSMYGLIPILEMYIDRLSLIYPEDIMTLVYSLNIAIAHNSLEAVKFLISKYRFSQANLITAMNIAVSLGHSEIMTVLINSGTQVDINNLLTAVEKQQLDAIRLIINHGVDNPRALNLAVERGYFKVVKELLELGLDANGQDGSPLAIAMENEHTDIANLLVSYGANV